MQLSNEYQEQAWDCTTDYFFEYQGGWRPEAPHGLADELYDFFKDTVVKGKGMPGKQSVPAEELWYDTSDEEIVINPEIGIDTCILCAYSFIRCKIIWRRAGYLSTGSFGDSSQFKGLYRSILLHLVRP